MRSSAAVSALCFILLCTLVRSDPEGNHRRDLRVNHNHNYTRPCALPALVIQLFSLILPISRNGDAHGPPTSAALMSCEERFAFQLLRRGMPEEYARKYAVQNILGCGLNAVTVGLLLDGVVGPVVKIVILDTSSKNVYIPKALTGGFVRPAKFFGEHQKHRRLYNSYRELSANTPAVFKKLSFQLFGIYNVSNYTFFKDESASSIKQRQRTDVGFYTAERIPSDFKRISWSDWKKTPDRVYLNLLFSSMVQLFRELRFVHGDMHMGNIHYNLKSRKLAIFDFDRGLFLSVFSEYMQHILFLRDYFTPLAFLMAYYKSISIEDKVIMSNAYCELALEHLKEIGPLKLSTQAQRIEIESYKQNYLKIIQDPRDYVKIKAEKDRIYDSLDVLFWKYSNNY